MLSLGNNITSSSAIESKYSLNLDGTDDHLDCGIVDFDTNNFSISLWFKIADGVTWDQHAALLDNRNTAGVGLGCVIWFEGTGQVRFFSVFGSGLDLAESHVTGLAVDTWHHIAVTVNRSGDQVLYANGSEANRDDISSFSSVDITNSLSLLIGKYRGSGGKYIEGKIDEVAIWNIELDSNAVSAIYNSGRPFNLNFDRGNYDNSANLQQYWKMGDGPNDDKADGIVHDAHNPGFSSEKLVNSDLSSSGDISTSSFSLGWIVTDDANIGSSIAGGELILEHPNGQAAVDPSRVWACTNGSNTNALTVGKVYKFTYTVSDVDGVTQLQYNHDVWYDLPETVGTHYVYWRQTASQHFVLMNHGNNSTIKLSSVSIVELNGFPGMTSGGPTFSSDAP